MCIKNAPYFHQKSVSWALNMMLFLDALVVMLFIKFVPNSTIRKYSSAKNFLNYGAKSAPINAYSVPLLQKDDGIKVP